MKKNNLILVLLPIIFLALSCERNESFPEVSSSKFENLKIILSNGDIKNIAQNQSFKEFILKNIQEDFEDASRQMPVEISKIEVVSTDMEKSTFIIEYQINEQAGNMAITLWNILSTDFNYEKIITRSGLDELDINTTYKTKYKCVRENCNNGCSVRVILGSNQITCFCGTIISTDGSCSLEIN